MNTAPETLTLSPKEELAVIVQRIKKHEAMIESERGKALLDVASDCVRMAMIYANDK